MPEQDRRLRAPRAEIELRAAPAEAPKSAGARLGAMRAHAPAIHQIATPLTQRFQAAVLAAAGARPVSVQTREEVTEVVAATAGLALSIEAVTPALLDTMLWAAETARGAGHPWVLDAAEMGLTDYRRQPSAALLARGPAAIAGTAGDIFALAGLGALSGAPEAAVDAGADLAMRSGAVVAISGAANGADMVLTDGRRAAIVHGGDPVGARVPGYTAGRTALLVALLATTEGNFEATAAALALDAAAAEEAGRRAAGPGSFPVAYLDSLAALTPSALDEVTRITPL